MIIPDTNLLIYAYNAADPDHARAARWWRGLLGGRRDVGVPVVVILAFVRLTTSPRFLVQPLALETCLGLIESWFVRDHVRLLPPSGEHLPLLLRCLREAGAEGNLSTDAHLAALALEYNAELHTADTDFKRFAEVRYVNPLKD